MKTEISFILNGSEVNVTADGHLRLIDVLRDTMSLTGTKEGCGVDGRAVNSCLYPVHEIEGKSVITIEGLHMPKNKLSKIQQAFVDNGAIQCGFCTPGMIMSAKALLDSNPNPSEEEIRDAFQGNLCRCTGYVQIIEAVQKVAGQLKVKK